MFTLNQFKKVLLLSSFVLLSHSHLAHSNFEVAFSFGKKFQLGGAFKGGYDLVYRIPINHISSTALGLRINTLQRFNKVLSDRNHILFTFLTNYRLHVTEPFFIGAIAGIDILKTYSLHDAIELNENANLIGALSTNEYLWNRFSADLGIEFGYQADSGFLMKLEVGYDLLSFRCIGDIVVDTNGIRAESEDDESSDETCTTKFNGVYATVGIGYHF